MLEDLNTKITNLTTMKSNLDLLASRLNSSVLSDDEYSVSYISENVKKLSEKVGMIIGLLNVQYVSLYQKKENEGDK